MLDEGDAVHEALAHELLLDVEGLVVLHTSLHTSTVSESMIQGSTRRCEGGGHMGTQHSSLVRTEKVWKRRSSRRKRVVMEASTTGHPFFPVFSFVS